MLTVTGGVATATWVVLSAGSTQLDTYTFPLLIANAGINDLNQLKVAGSLAAVSTVAVASATAPVPRYRDFGVPQKLVSLRIKTTVQASAGVSGGASKALLKQGGARAAGVGVGGNVTFTQQLLNDTTDPGQGASNVVIQNNLPTGLNLVSCTASSGASCQINGNQAQVDYVSMSAGQNETVTVVAQVDPSLADGTVLQTDASASSDQVTQDSSASLSSTSFVVLNGIPVAVAGSPAFGNGSSQTFSFQFSHPYGWSNLGVVNILINNFLDGRKACYLAYAVTQKTLYLVNDAGDAGGPFAGSVTLPNTSPIQNSQCAVSLGAATGVGTTLTLTMTITFTPSFGGNRIMYVAARDQAQSNSAWQALGTWQAPGATAGTISAASMNPPRGTGSSSPFTFTFTDSKGVNDLGVTNILINNFIDGRQACYLAYVAASNALLLVDDAGNAGGPFVGMVLDGGTGAIQNSQCRVTQGATPVVKNGNTLTLNLNLAFSSGFVGNRIVYVAARDARDGNNTDWQALGSWTVQ